MITANKSRSILFPVRTSDSINDVLKNACTRMMLQTETDERKVTALFTHARTHTHTHTHTHIYIYIMLLGYINADYICLFDVYWTVHHCDK